MQDLTPQEILEGLRKKDGKILDFIYENHFYPIQSFINRNSGSDEDAQDVFQDAILIIFQKLGKEEIVLNCSFGTYIFSICRLLWLKQLETLKNRKAFIEESGETVELDDSIEETRNKNDRYIMYLDHFNKLSYNCQKILEMFLARVSLREIARILGLKSEQYVKKRKHICKEKLVDSIKNDMKFENKIEKKYFSNLKKI